MVLIYYFTDKGKRQSSAHLERSVKWVTHPFEELLKMSQYLFLSPGHHFWLLIKARQI